MPREGRELPRSACFEALSGGFTLVESSLSLNSGAVGSWAGFFCAASSLSLDPGAVEVMRLWAVTHNGLVNSAASSHSVVTGVVADDACRATFPFRRRGCVTRATSVGFAASSHPGTRRPWLLDERCAIHCSARRRQWIAVSLSPQRMVTSGGVIAKRGRCAGTEAGDKTLALGLGPE